MQNRCIFSCSKRNRKVRKVRVTTGRGEGDKTTTAYNVDPGFANPVEGDFTPSAPEIRAHASGDPRWLN